MKKIFFILALMQVGQLASAFTGQTHVTGQSNQFFTDKAFNSDKGRNVSDKPMVAFTEESEQAYSFETNCLNPVDGGTIAADQTGCNSFDSAIIENSSLPTGQEGTLEYKWQHSTTSNSSGFSDIPGSNAITYDPAPITQTTWYKRLARVNCTSDWIGAAESNVVTITVNPSPAMIITNPEAICSPATVDLTSGEVTLGSAPDLIYTYWTDAAATLAYHTPEAALSGTYYIKGTAANGCFDVKPVLVKIWELPNNVTNGFTGGTICEGSPGLLKFNAEDNSFFPPHIIEYTDGTNVWEQLIESDNDFIFTVPVSPIISTTYRLVSIANGKGCIRTADFKKETARITVKPLPQGSLSANGPFCGSGTGKLTWTATSGSDPFTLIYTDGISEHTVSGVVSGNAFDVNDSPVTGTTNYSLVSVTDAIGCSRTTGFTSSTAILTVNPFPGEANPISGPAGFHQGSSDATYSVDPIPDAIGYVWQYSGTGATIHGPENSITIDFAMDASDGMLTVHGHNNCGDGAEASLYLSGDKTLNLTSVLLEGLYDGEGLMRQAQNETGPEWPDECVDHITIELHSEHDYSIIAFTATEVPLSASGAATLTVSGDYNDSYYITIKHRNSIETTTASAVSFATRMVSQSFGSTTYVYGGNLKSAGSDWLIYGGDVNQDGQIDANDMNRINIGSTSILTGYSSEDINGDGLVDASDMLIIDNNSAHAVIALKPQNP